MFGFKKLIHQFGSNHLWLQEKLSELCGDWAEPKTGASIERAVRKGNKDPKLITAKNRERAKRRKRAKEKKRASKAAAKASSSNVEVVVVQDDDLQDDDEEDDDNDDGNDEKPEEVIEDEDPLELCLVSRLLVLLDRPSSVTVSLTNKITEEHLQGAEQVLLAAPRWRWDVAWIKINL